MRSAGRCGLPWKALQKTEEATQEVSISLAAAKEVRVDAALEAKERKSIPFFLSSETPEGAVVDERQQEAP